MKINIGSNVYVYPNPMMLLGTIVDGAPNFMALGWVSRVNSKPPLIGIGVNQAHLTPKGILECRTFSLNCPSANMVDFVDYCGLVSGRQVDKSNVLETFYGKLDTAPMLKLCPLCMECRLVETVDLPTNYWFIGEIVAAYTEERFLTDGTLDIKKIDPLLLSMPDNSYWRVGDYVGEAWEIGRHFKGQP